MKDDPLNIFEYLAIQMKLITLFMIFLLYCSIPYPLWTPVSNPDAITSTFVLLYESS